MVDIFAQEKQVLVEPDDSLIYQRDDAAVRSFIDGSLSGHFVIPDGVTRITDSAFFKQTGLTSIDIPDSVTYLGDAAFFQCSLSEITLPSGIQKISSQAFFICSRLKKIDCYVTEIKGSQVFYLDQNLETLILRSDTVCSLSSAMFGDTKIGKGTGYIYVKAALVDPYKAATNWSTYANQFRAQEDYPDICGEVAA